MVFYTGPKAVGALGPPGPPGPYATCPHCTNGDADFNSGWIRGHYIPKGADIPEGSFPDAPCGTPGGPACPSPDSPEGKAMAAAEAAAEAAAAAERRAKAREGQRTLEWCGKRSKCTGKYPDDNIDHHKPMVWFKTEVCHPPPPKTPPTFPACDFNQDGTLSRVRFTD